MTDAIKVTPDDLCVRLCEAVDNMDDDSIALFASEVSNAGRFIAENDGFTVISENGKVKTQYSVEDALVACHQAIDSLDSDGLIAVSKMLLSAEAIYDIENDSFSLDFAKQNETIDTDLSM